MMTPEQKQMQKLTGTQRAKEIRQIQRHYETDYQSAQKLWGQLKGRGELEMILMESEDSGMDCPICKAHMVRKTGANGDFWGCSKYPECRGTRQMRIEEAPVSEASIDDAKRCVDLAMNYIGSMGGIAKAEKFLRLAKNMLSDS